MAGTDEGFGMKVARRFINNVTVQIEDVTVSFVSKALGIATSLQLPNLAVLSTDENFQARYFTVDCLLFDFQLDV